MLGKIGSTRKQVRQPANDHDSTCKHFGNRRQAGNQRKAQMLRNAELRRAGRSTGWGGGKITRLGGEAEWLGAEKKNSRKAAQPGPCTCRRRWVGSSAGTNHVTSVKKSWLHSQIHRSCPWLARGPRWPPGATRCWSFAGAAIAGRRRACLRAAAPASGWTTIALCCR